MEKLQWKTEKRKIGELIGYNKNPRKISDTQMQQLQDSITKFNLVEIPAIDKDNTILAGHQRLKAMQLVGRGAEEIDVRVPNRKLTVKERDEYLVRSNKNTGEWDNELLAEFDIEMLADVGFDSKELDRIFKDDVDDELDVEKEVAKIVTPTSKYGDVYLLGDHRLMCGDATLEVDVDKLMAGMKADMVFCDPPYNIDYTGKTSDALKIENDKKSSDEFKTFLKNSFRNMHRTLKDGGAIYVCHADTERVNFTQAFREVGFYLSSVIIWVKNNATFGRQDYFWKHEPILYGWKEGGAHTFYGNATHTTVWEHEPTDEEMIAEMKKIIVRDEEGESTVWRVDRPARSKEHPTMKPVKLVSKAIRNSSKRGDVIQDLFGGAGSTLIACESLNRICYTMELDCRYVDVIIKRWELLTKQQAKKL